MTYSSITIDKHGSIYKQHDKAFQNVAAYLIIKGGEPVAKIAFKYPRDGASRLWAYAQVFGYRMARGYASGYGYDKATAATEDAFKSIDPTTGYDDSKKARILKRIQSNLVDSGYDWTDQLRNAGFKVHQVV